MKVSLIYPRFRYDTVVGELEEPLGLLYLASVLRDGGREVSFSDMTFCGALSDLDGNIEGADLVGISSTTPLFEKAKEVAAYVRQRAPQARLLIGGPHPTIDPEAALDGGFDLAAIGEAETTVGELTARIEKGDPHTCPGIAYREDGALRTNPRPAFVHDLDELAFPARDLVDYRRHGRYGIVATRGCPHNCLFCKPTQDLLFGSRVRRRSAENVVEEMAACIALAGPLPFQFKDDNFTVYSPAWLERMADAITERGIEPRWVVNSRIDTITYEKLKIMKRAGCYQLCFGVESGSQRVLDFYRKGTTVGRIVTVFDWCRKLGLKTNAFLMLGAPLETRADLEATYRLVKRIRPYNWVLSVTTPIPGNDLFRYLTERRLIRVEDWEGYDHARNASDLRLPVRLEHLSEEDIREYRDKINRYMKWTFLRQNLLSPRIWRELATSPAIRRKAAIFFGRHFGVLKRAGG